MYAVSPRASKGNSYVPTKTPAGVNSQILRESWSRSRLPLGATAKSRMTGRPSCDDRPKSRSGWSTLRSSYEAGSEELSSAGVVEPGLVGTGIAEPGGAESAVDDDQEAG